MKPTINKPILEFALPEENLISYLTEREWLVTNGLGGYASGSLLGISSRRYHGLFVPNLPAPHGRTLMIPRFDAEITTQSKKSFLSGAEFSDGRLLNDSSKYLTAFRLEFGLPVWTFTLEGNILEKRIFMPYGQNSVYIKYSLVDGNFLKLNLRPFLTFRKSENRLGHPAEWPFRLTMSDNRRYEVEAFHGAPLLRMTFQPAKARYIGEERSESDVFYRIENKRELDAVESLFSPGRFESELGKGESLSFVASTETWDVIEAHTDQVLEVERVRREKLLFHVPKAEADPFVAQLVLAADQFVVLPLTRIDEVVLMNAAGESFRSIIAGYHWFTDWGRDTMISLEGLTLCTGRQAEAKAILQTFAHYIRNGLLPNHFPEGSSTAIYNTVDATFWFFHALEKYYRATKDLEMICFLFPALQGIIEAHVKGTDFGIHMDPNDSLITAAAEGYQLTWMDAKVEDWVVTPRRGKPVEIQALWYNALKLMEDWSKLVGENPEKYSYLSKNVHDSFNKKFWNPASRYLFDVVGESSSDDKLRPNQIFSLSLSYPVLDREYWKPVVDAVQQKLLTPYGLRTLEVGHEDFRPRYEGNRWSRDAAYHQGLVWPWLIGSFIDAWLKVYEDRDQAKGFLKAFEPHLRDAGVGTISEIFDAQEPYNPGGCIAQAWSVAELLRLTLKLSPQSSAK